MDNVDFDVFSACFSFRPRFFEREISHFNWGAFLFLEFANVTHTLYPKLTYLSKKNKYVA